MRLSKIATGFSVILMAVVGLAACSPDGPRDRSDTGLAVGALAGGLLGSTVGKGRGRLATTVIGTVIGGLVGSEIGRSLDRRDRELAQSAEYDAFERGRSDEPVRWSNPDNGRHGEVIPGRPYRRASSDCRDYTHAIIIDGRRQTMRGTACRNPDGTWRNVS